MNHSSEIFKEHSPQLPIDSSKTRTSNSKCQLSIADIDSLILGVSDLIADTKFTPWFCKQAYRLGGSRFIGLAERARKGKHPARLFSSLLSSAK